MFTVKATYRGETRKFCFPQENGFPSFAELFHQLYRVFPISSNFTLYQFLFFPDSIQQSRILLSKEVRNEKEYIDATAQFSGRTWPTPLLKFTIVDDTPHKAPAAPSSVPAQPPQIISVSHIPPPPIIFSSTPVHIPTSAMDVDTPQPKRASTASHQTHAPCCAMAKCKTDVHSLLVNFQEDLTRLVSGTFGPATSNAPNSSPMNNVLSTFGATNAPPSMVCSQCLASCCGTWHECDMCHVVLCAECQNRDPKTTNAYCYANFGAHIMKERKVCTRSAPLSPSTSSVPPGQSLLDPPPPRIHFGVYCDACYCNIAGTRHKCADCPDYDLCTPCYERDAPARHNPFHVFVDIEKPNTPYQCFSRGQSGALNTVTSPLHAESVAHWATCDLCDSRIRGDRFKCVDCPDFDTCASCFSITAEQHPHHSFVRIVKPLDYILRGKPNANGSHLATCNECMDVIKGVRYKCLHPSCPDYDLCAKCEGLPIPIHPETHPLVKLRSRDTLIPQVARLNEPALAAFTTDEPLQEQASRTALSFNQGFMRNPYLSDSPSDRESLSSASSVRLVHTPSPPSPIIDFNELETPTFAPRIPSPVALNLDEQFATSTPRFRTPSPQPLVQLEAEESVSVAVNTETDTRPHSPTPRLPSLWQRFSASPTPVKESNGAEDNADIPLIDTNNAATTCDSGSPTHSSFTVKPESNQDTANTTPVWPTMTPGLDHLLDTSAPIAADAGKAEPVPLVENAPSAFSLSGFLRARSSLRALEGQISKLRIEVPAENTLKASLVSVVTVSDGQVFPPGAEFVKCWKLINNGEHAWPETTELVFLAGELLGYKRAVKVGVVEPGTALELSTSELKAPEHPGRYVSYWRLRHDGQVFGDSIWIDINVADADNDRSDESLASSSIIMPSTAPSQEASSTVGVSPTEVSTFGIPRVTEGDRESEDGSIISSGSGISSPPSSLEDDAIWQEAQRNVGGDTEWDVLLDEHSSEEL